MMFSDRKISLLCGLAALTMAVATSAKASTLSPADAAGLNLKTAGDYAIVGLAGASETLKVNSGPISGGATAGVLVGQGMQLDFSGGGGGAIPNGVHGDDSAYLAEVDDLENPTTFTLVSSAVTAAAKASAEAVAAYAAGLTPDIAFNSDISDTLFQSNGSLTVINVDGDVDDNISFNGSATDFFVINVTGQVDTNSPMTLNGGVTAANILWNLTASSGQCFKTAGGNVSFGTFLATNGCDFQFSNLDLTGALINTAGSIQHVSGSTTAYEPFKPTSPVPLPAGFILLGSGLGVLAAAHRIRQAT